MSLLSVSKARCLRVCHGLSAAAARTNLHCYHLQFNWKFDSDVQVPEMCTFTGSATVQLEVAIGAPSHSCTTVPTSPVVVLTVTVMMPPRTMMQESYDAVSGAAVYNVALDFSTQPTSNNVFDFDGSPPTSMVGLTLVYHDVLSARATIPASTTQASRQCLMTSSWMPCCRSSFATPRTQLRAPSLASSLTLTCP